MSDLLNTRKPKRNAGAITFEKLPAYITLPSVSIDLIVGTFSPANLNSPYGLSSNIAISYLQQSSYIFFLFSREVVIPVGFWKDGIVYNNFAFGLASNASFNASIFIPSCSIGIPISLAPYERNVLRHPTNAGSSVSTTSPSFTSALVVRSAHCCPPDTINNSLSSNSKPSFVSRYFFIVSRSGV